MKNTSGNFCNQIGWILPVGGNKKGWLHRYIFKAEIWNCVHLFPVWVWIWFVEPNLFESSIMGVMMPADPLRMDSKLNSRRQIRKFCRVCLALQPSSGFICSKTASLEGWGSGPGENSAALMSYVTSRHRTSSDVSPTPDFGGLRSNPQI